MDQFAKIFPSSEYKQILFYLDKQDGFNGIAVRYVTPDSKMASVFFGMEAGLASTTEQALDFLNNRADDIRNELAKMFIKNLTSIEAHKLVNTFQSDRSGAVHVLDGIFSRLFSDISRGKLRTVEANLSKDETRH